MKFSSASMLTRLVWVTTELDPGVKTAGLTLAEV
jgi:hypothetical protein